MPRQCCVIGLPAFPVPLGFSVLRAQLYRPFVIVVCARKFPVDRVRARPSEKPHSSPVRSMPEQSTNQQIDGFIQKQPCPLRHPRYLRQSKRAVTY